MRERFRRWRARTFERVTEQPLRRRTSDWLRVAVGVLLLLVAARHAGDATASEQALFQVFHTLPSSLLPIFRAIYGLGTLWVVGLTVVSALVGQRRRLARDLLVAGFLARASGRVLGELALEGSSVGKSLRAVTRLGPSPSFPVVRLAVIVAVISVAGPYVTRPTKVIGRVLIVAVVIAALYLGNAYPNDVFGGLVLGWVIAATVHLVFGSPGGRPTTKQVQRSLTELGVDAADIRLARRQPTGSTLMWAHDEHGPLRIKVIGRDEADAQLLSKLWRFVVYKDSGPRLAVTRVEQVEHEGFMMLLARAHGVQVPPVLVAGSAGPRAALVVQQSIRGTRLARLDPDQISDELLASTWGQVGKLHEAGVVHGHLDADHVIVDEANDPWLVGFAAARATVHQDAVAEDVAQLIASTAPLVGNERSVRAASAAVGADGVLGALPLLQPSVVTGATRRAIGPHHGNVRHQLARLRAVGSAELDVDEPELVHLQRARTSSVLLALGTLVAVAVLLTAVGDPTQVLDTLRHADVGWLAVAIVVSFASNIGYAIGLRGTVARRLPLWPTTELQVAMSFSNLAVPGIGGMGMQVRFLQKQGLDLSSAVTAGGFLSTLGNLGAAFALFGLAFAIEPARINLSLLPTSGLAELTGITALVVVLLALVVGGIPRLRRAVLAPLRRALSTTAVLLRSPRQLTQLLGGNVLASLLSTWCLVACLAAFQGEASFWAVLAANIGVVTVASIVPIPGGGNAVGTVGLSAALVAFGVPRDIAVATVLTNQLVYYYLPAVPGWFATRHLATHDYL